MRRFLTVLLCMMIFVTLTACGNTASIGDNSSVLKVVIQDEEADTEAYDYLAVYQDGKTSEIDAFHPDDMIFYTAASEDFTSSIKGNTVVNKLTATTLIDENGNQTRADETITEMMQTVADMVEHDIWQFQVITGGKRYFAFVKLNVNWQSPCILYEYDASTDSLTELCRWDGVDLLGISI
ncbi:MAG: hypothetical protein LUF92_04570 [Clostridiales bacterium]|nr:hypothetical protein [Clostridiales bacterium]